MLTPMALRVISRIHRLNRRYCKVKGSDRALYILRVEESPSEWSLIMFASPKAQLIAPQSGAGAHPHRPTNKG